MSAPVLFISNVAPSHPHDFALLLSSTFPFSSELGALHHDVHTFLMLSFIDWLWLVGIDKICSQELQQHTS